ncbi:MAG TPA: hypothetical protein VNN74_07230 [Candidatus Micrarchaeia archaeon]|nr:hypothetical protein [Candidatus Micrarchaeia archaeon]
MEETRQGRLRGRRARRAVAGGLFVPLPQDRRSCILPLIGLATPVGLLVVNASAWVILHLGAFRLGIAISAFVSSLALNGLAGVNVYRFVHGRWPDFLLSREEHQLLVFWLGFVVVVVTAVLAAVFSFIGMENAHQLPNGIAVITALGAVGIPLLLSGGLSRWRRRGTAVVPER